ncbi:hypothetical protein HU200_055400 [Digitaria exilis]|uniref:Uncharacterized protein n=1 Tax=Digitaria exilis TaxID=1010633 RepID=A0A835E478_9POAL|nr:hypothetical protein HU200_055400 [Digitaria exilis]
MSPFSSPVAAAAAEAWQPGWRSELAVSQAQLGSAAWTQASTQSGLLLSLFGHGFQIPRESYSVHRLRGSRSHNKPTHMTSGMSLTATAFSLLNCQPLDEVTLSAPAPRNGMARATKKTRITTSTVLPLGPVHPTPQSAPVSAPAAGAVLDMDDALQLLDEFPPRFLVQYDSHTVVVQEVGLSVLNNLSCSFIFTFRPPVANFQSSYQNLERWFSNVTVFHSIFGDDKEVHQSIEPDERSCFMPCLSAVRMDPKLQ